MARKITPTERKESNQAIVFFISIILILATIIIVPIWIKNYNSSFVYGGIPFVKEKHGELSFYHGRMPFINKEGEISHYNMYFRTDPRKNNVSVTANFSFSNQVSLSLQNEAGFCDYAVIANGLLGEFVASYLTFVEKINIGVTDAKTATELNLSHITCNSASRNNTVIITRLSNETSITQADRYGCYYLNVGNCENLKTVEKFVTSVIAQSNSISLAK